MPRRPAKGADTSPAERPGLVLDAGALQALERRHIRLLVDLRRSHELGLAIRVSAGSLAQSWREGPRSATLARLLKQPCTVVVQVDERAARNVGEFITSLHLAEQERPDVVDAHVALVARATQSLVWTSDPKDMARYRVEASLIRKL